MKAITRHLRSVQRPPERIKSYFEHEPVRYAAQFKFIDAGSTIGVDRRTVKRFDAG